MDLGKLRQLPASLVSLGRVRLTLLAIAGATAFAAIFGSSWYLSRPHFETAFVGLASSDASRIAVVLRDSGIPFDVSADGTRVMIARGQVSRARALLAQRGLPGGSGGYELFDKLGPMGLTSFMQEVTRVRALEGELARTIQGLRGIVAARVHIVLPDSGSFRRAAQPPSASVVIRSETADDATAVPAIRHLVSAAVPGMSLENVRIVSAHGAVLSAEGDEAAPSRLVELQRSVASSLQNNIRRTLAPYLGVGNLEVSVSVALNIDRRQVTETSFDPDKRTERSSRVMRETGSTQTNAQRPNASVEQNIPGDSTSAPAVDATRKASQKREEVTNYEVPSRSMATTSAGYRVERITAAVVLNRKRLVEQLGVGATPDAISREVAEIERIAVAAAGIDTSRGDKLTVTALDFGNDTTSLAPAPSLAASELLATHAGTAMEALTIIVVAVLLLLVGFRPLTRAVLGSAARVEPTMTEALQTQSQTGRAVASPVQSSGASSVPSQIGRPASAQPHPGSLAGATPTRPASRLAAEFEQRRDALPGRRVAEMVELDRQQAVTVLRRWIRDDRR